MRRFRLGASAAMFTAIITSLFTTDQVAVLVLSVICGCLGAFYLDPPRPRIKEDRR